jgi:hypothetical protein
LDCFEALLEPFGAPQRLEIQGNGPGDGPGPRIVFLSDGPFAGTPCRKPLLENPFGFGAVRPAVPKVLREAAKLDPFLKRISVHNIVAYQKIGGPV